MQHLAAEYLSGQPPACLPGEGQDGPCAKPLTCRGEAGLLVEDVGADEFDFAVAIEVHRAARRLWLRRTETLP